MINKISRQILGTTILMAIALIILGGFFPNKAVAAGPFIIETPPIINLKAKPGETARTAIKILNDSISRWTAFGFDKEVNPSDKTIANDHSLTRWLQYNHALVINPATTTPLDLGVSVFPFAKPGFYYADLTFVPAVTRSDAEKRMGDWGKTIRLNFEVLDDSHEELELLNFYTEKQFNFVSPITFLVELKNSGNRKLKVTGSVRVSDRSGKQLGIIDLVATDLGVGEIKTVRAELSGLVDMAKYKGYLSLHYGNDSKLVQDSTYFWLFNPKKLFLIFVFGLLVSLIIGHFLHISIARHHE